MPSMHAVLRVRPPKRHETAYLDCEPRAGTRFEAGELVYHDTFTAVLGPSSSQADAFKACGLPLVEAALHGKHVCLFAYGQTGSGKTFSMYGAEGGKNPSKLDGIVPAICAEIFRRKQDLEKKKYLELELCATLIEIQGNSAIDLLGEPAAAGQMAGQMPRLKVPECVAPPQYPKSPHRPTPAPTPPQCVSLARPIPRRPAQAFPKPPPPRPIPPYPAPPRPPTPPLPSPSRLTTHASKPTSPHPPVP